VGQVTTRKREEEIVYERRLDSETFILNEENYDEDKQYTKDKNK
jgi:hypothetical protein